MKLLILFFLILTSVSAKASLRFQWLGVSGFIISDGKTNLVFDPAMTTVSVSDLLFNRLIKSNHEEVNYWINRCGVEHLEGIFINHSHFDHVIDAPYLANKFKAKFFGSSSTLNVAKGENVDIAQLEEIKLEEEYSVGDFKVKAFSTPHAPHFMGVLFMNGKIEKPLTPPAKVWDYLVGESFSFLITHHEGNILFSSVSYVPEPDSLKSVKADTLLLTIANRRSSEELVMRRVIPAAVKKVIPLHHDNFFLPMKRENGINELWGVRTEEFTEQMKKSAPQIELLWPHYCEKITI